MKSVRSASPISQLGLERLTREVPKTKVAPEVAPAVAQEAAPEVVPGVAPEVAPEVAPAAAPEVVQGAAQEVAQEVAPEVALEVALEVARLAWRTPLPSVVAEEPQLQRLPSGGPATGDRSAEPPVGVAPLPVRLARQPWPVQAHSPRHGVRPDAPRHFVTVKRFRCRGGHALAGSTLCAK